jgi:methionine-rich copper-binding protein CopC
MKVRSLIGMTFATVVLGLASTAHARLESPRSKEPEATETMDANLILAFSQKVDPSASQVEIRTSRGASVMIGELRISGNGTELEVPLPSPLRPGKYTIRWLAVSTEGLVDDGGYDFTIAPTAIDVPDVAQQIDGPKP